MLGISIIIALLSFALVLAVVRLRSQGQRLSTLQGNAAKSSKLLGESTAIMDSAAEGFITITESGSIQFFNKAAERIFGYAKEDVIGKNVSMLMPAHYSSSHDGYIDNYLSTGEKTIIGIGREVEGLRKNGEVFPMDLAVSEMSGASERTFAGIVRDISEHKRDIEALEVSRQQLRLIIDLVPHMIFAKDHRGNFLIANRAIAEAYGVSVETLLKTPQRELHKDVDELREMSHEDKRVIEDGERLLAPRQYFTDAAGKLRVLQTYKIPMEYGLEKVPVALGISVDITELEEKDAKLRVNVERQEALIRNAPMPIAASEVGQGIIIANDAFQKLTGYDAEELQQLTVIDITHPEDQAETKRRIETAVTGVAPEYQYRKRFLNKEGDVVHVEMFNTLLRNDDGSPGLLLGQVVDLTERLAKDKLVRDSEARLAHAGRLALLGEMTAGIAHEINQPLTAVSIYAQTGLRLIDAGKYDKLAELFEKLTTQALRAGATMERMQRLAKHKELEIESVDCNTIISDACKLAETDVRLHSGSIKLQLADNLPLVRCDVVQIQQVLINLIRNALEAMEGSPNEGDVVVAISSRVLGASVEIAVSDAGSGISKEAEAQIFSAFNSTKPTGMGMGLSICQYIIDAHGGELSFRKKENGNQGTVFYFTLPLDGVENE